MALHSREVLSVTTAPPAAVAAVVVVVAVVVDVPRGPESAGSHRRFHADHRSGEEDVRPANLIPCIVREARPLAN